MRVILFIVFLLLVNLSFGFSKNCLLNADSSVRKTVFKIDGKPVERQVYFNYLKCKHYRAQLIGSSVFIGLGVVALAGSIPLLMRAHNYDTDIEQAYGGGGIALACFGAFGLGIGIPFTIKNLKDYRSKCKDQTIYFSPQLNGFALAFKF